MSPTVESLRMSAHEILDSRSMPTVMVQLEVGGRDVRVRVPSGASTGIYEAHELRDGDERFLGFGVQKALQSVIEIAGAIKDIDYLDQEGIDKTMCELDGTTDKSRLGANAILAVSLGVAHAAAEYKNVPLFKYLADLCGNRLNARLSAQLGSPGLGFLEC